jgi:putative DNA primase/helicase
MSAIIERDIQSALMVACADAGIEYKHVPVDGKWHRADLLNDRNGKADASIMLFSDGMGGIVMNWKQGEPRTFFVDDGRKLSDAEREERKRRADESRAKAEQERAARAARAADLSQIVLLAGRPLRSDHPYLISKGIPAHNGLREIPVKKLSATINYTPQSDDEPLTGRIIIAPIYSGIALLSLEFIDESGRKSALAGGAKSGGYWPKIDPHYGDAEKVIVCEGIADNLSLEVCNEGALVFAALSCGNLPKVAKTMRAFYPSAQIVIAGDLGNGAEKAREAAQAVGGVVAFPDFGLDRQDNQTDFNDMHLARGADAVRACIDAAVATMVEQPERLPQAVIQQEDDAPTEAESDEQVIERLAGLKPMQYDRVRKEEAKRLGVQVSTLDRMVASARSEGGDHDDGPFDSVEPWHEPVDGAALLADLVRLVRRFIVCDEATAHGSALWITMTWLIDSVDVAPIAAITAPEKRCGKSQLLFLMARLSSRALAASNISPPALFRAIEAWRPTLLIDEADAFMRENEELRGLLNSGHTRDSAYVIRTVGDDHTPKQFFVWGAKAIAGIGHLADTLMDRSITLELRRKLPHEQVDKLRHAEPGTFERLRSKLARWAEDNANAVRMARPALPDALHDRAADNWEPLLQIADVAGGQWPEIARRAALKLSGESEQSQSAGAELLTDIKSVFDKLNVSRISMADLLAELLADDEAPWKTWNRGREMTARQLGKKLSEYGIRSKTVKIGYDAPKGFTIDQFKDAFDRYLSSPMVSPVSPVTQSPSSTGAASAVTEAQSLGRVGIPSVTGKPLPHKAGDRVTNETGATRCEGSFVTDDEAEAEL